MTGWQLLGLWLIGTPVIGVVVGKFLKYGSGAGITITDADAVSSKREGTTKVEGVDSE